MDLAYHHGEMRTTKQIAVATKVPTDFLAKILKGLSQQGLIRSQRGLHGGFALDRDPKALTVYEVIAAVDPPKRILSCPLGLEAHRHKLCPLHKKLDEAMAMAERAFRDTTIAEVTAAPINQPLGHIKRSELTISGGLLPVVNPRKSKRTTS